jgi:hypothetical protein
MNPEQQNPQAPQVNINIDPSVKPLWADEVIITRMVKQRADEKGKLEKDGNLALIFVDGFTKTAVARITLNKITAKALGNLILANVKDLEKELSKKIDLAKKNMSQSAIVASTAKSNYIG